MTTLLAIYLSGWATTWAGVWTTSIAGDEYDDPRQCFWLGMVWPIALPFGVLVKLSLDFVVNNKDNS